MPRHGWPKGVSGNPAGMPRRVDLTNQVVGRWTVLRHMGGEMWLCRCDCGTERQVRQGHLRGLKSKSCGCLQREVAQRHGRSRSVEYRTWAAMLQRCLNSDCPTWRYYGSQGVSVCDRWQQSFEQFLADMGPRPSPRHSLDRINPFGNYEPQNCRWATRDVQARNKRASYEKAHQTA